VRGAGNAILFAMDFGKIGIWRPTRFGADGVQEIEAAGFGALWLGGSPAVEQARPFLEATSTITVGTSILNVWQHEPGPVAAAHAALTADFPGRFVLGVGIGHPEATSDYSSPLTTMRTFLEGLEASPTPVPRDELLVAAIGPKMLRLTGEHASGTIPYFIAPGHTAAAREALGPDAIVAPEIAVVVEPDAETGRAIARQYAAMYLGLSNYTRNLLPFGFTEADIADGGSDRLIDAVVPHGTAEQLAEVVRGHLESGADHVCLQPLGHGETPIDDYRALANALL
jgi:probable F420-dependent oxidoreductase